ncbi:MAG: hypothetical protein LBS60_07450 [Deltaproteobacteria bacterium]|jgi:hypothetical protein|nr:hypothetical protein [Deltaproteobacteria bacterium]
MTNLKEFRDINVLAGLLANGLSEAPPADMPEDVAEALKAAKKQFEDLPGVIDDLNLAFNRYLTLSKTIKRMQLLAKEAGSLSTRDPEDSQYLEELEREFAGLARVVASEAGLRYFQGSGLTVSDPKSARAATTVLAYLDPVMENLSYEIRGQKSLILEAIRETINFIGIVAQSYPEAKGVAAINQSLVKVKLPENLDDPVVIAPTLH